MSKFYHIANKRDGRMIYNKEKLDHLTSILYDGQYLITFQRLEPKSSIKDYRRCYFSKLDALAFEAGDTRYGMHGLIKEHIIEKMIEENPEFFHSVLPEASTTYLNEMGWVNILDRLDLWAFTTYNVILQ